jgi:hypothetical protein
MLENFSDIYRQALIDAENRIKASWFKEVISEDVFIEIMKIQKWGTYEIFSWFWINEKIALEVLTQKQFKIFSDERKWEYVWMSKKLKDLIVDSIKVAASFKKKQASVEDFILSMIKTNSLWFTNFLNFVWVNPKDIEIALTSLANNWPKWDWVFDPIDNIIKALEEWLGQMNQNMEEVENNPFFANKKPEWDKKKDTATPALDFFW